MFTIIKVIIVMIHICSLCVAYDLMNITDSTDKIFPQ